MPTFPTPTKTALAEALDLASQLADTLSSQAERTPSVCRGAHVLAMAVQLGIEQFRENGPMESSALTVALDVANALARDVQAARGRLPAATTDDRMTLMARALSSALHAARQQPLYVAA